MTRHSVLDLGSNSFHVLVADVLEGGIVVPVSREREMLHLGAVVARHGHIPDTDRDRAIEVVAHFTELAGRMGADQRLAVATSAFRDATNGAEVAAAMSGVTGTPIRVIDAEEEARLAYRGVRASVAVREEPVLVLDLGGGSLELVVGRGPDVLWTASADVGVSRMSTGLPADPPKPRHVDALRDLVRDAVRAHRKAIRRHGPTEVIAVGGTIRAMARVVAAEEGTWLPATINQLPVATSEIAALRDRLVEMTAEERAAVPGMKDKRADRIHVAATILSTALETLRIEEFVLSDWGLREGALLEAVDATLAHPPELLRRREVARMRQQFTPDDPHLAHVADLALQLFDGTQSLHGMDDEDRDLLACGAGLHDVGESLALRGHHKHGAYLVEHAELRGFSPRDTAMLCSIVRFHKSRGMSPDYLPYGSLRRRDRRRVDQLVALLQVADGLDRARDQAVHTLDVRVDGHEVHVRLGGDHLRAAREEVDRKTGLFERVFDATVLIHADTSPNAGGPPA